jgi:hypothetical protein
MAASFENISLGRWSLSEIVSTHKGLKVIILSKNIEKCNKYYDLLKLFVVSSNMELESFLVKFKNRQPLYSYIWLVHNKPDPGRLDLGIIFGRAIDRIFSAKQR